jgi:hypothetical protein
MSRGLGKLQRKLLEGLCEYQREAGLGQLSYYAAGLTCSLEEDMPFRERYSDATYKATARAVAGLRGRGLVTTRIFKVPLDPAFLLVRNQIQQFGIDERLQTGDVHGRLP